jgi:hypothetical protein
MVHAQRSMSVPHACGAGGRWPSPVSSRCEILLACRTLPLDRLLRSVTEDRRGLRARRFAVVEMQ